MQTIEGKPKRGQQSKKGSPPRCGSASWVCLFLFGEKMVDVESFHENFENIIIVTPSDILFSAYEKIQEELLDRGILNTNKNKKRISNKKIKPIERMEVGPLPGIKHNIFQRLKFINSLMEQDWKYLFEEQSLSNKNDFYVYAHVSPLSLESLLRHRLKKYLGIDGFPFYIGKGKGDRAYDLNRNQGHGLKLKNLIAAGKCKEELVAIIKDGLTEIEALELESKLIYFFGTVYERHTKMGTSGFLYNLDIGKRPEFKQKKKVEPPKIILRRGNGG